MTKSKKNVIAIIGLIIIIITSFIALKIESTSNIVYPLSIKGRQTRFSGNSVLFNIKYEYIYKGELYFGNQRISKDILDNNDREFYQNIDTLDVIIDSLNPDESIIIDSRYNLD